MDEKNNNIPIVIFLILIRNVLELLSFRLFLCMSLSFGRISLTPFHSVFNAPSNWLSVRKMRWNFSLTKANNFFQLLHTFPTYSVYSHLALGAWALYSYCLCFRLAIDSVKYSNNFLWAISIHLLHILFGMWALHSFTIGTCKNPKAENFVCAHRSTHTHKHTHDYDIPRVHADLFRIRERGGGLSESYC